MPQRSFLIRLLVCIAFLLSTNTVGAQSDSGIHFLGSALKVLRWNSVSQGTVLVVNFPQQQNYFHDLFMVSPKPLTPTRTGLGVREIADSFHRRIVRLGSLTVLVPDTLTIYNDKPGKGDIYSGLSGGQKMKRLMASLTPAQMELVGGAGLGFADMTEAQRPLFDSLLPHPLRYLPGANSDPTHNIFDVSPHNPNEKILPQSDRLRAKVRIVRSLSYRPDSAGQSIAVQLLGQSPAQKEMPHLTILEADREDENTRFGVKIRREVPAYLKPQQINFDAEQLDMLVPVVDTKTIGDLIDKVAQTVHSDIRVDKRIGTLPVFVRGKAVRAGDLLKGLAWGIGGAFRHIGNVYLLTEDIEGTGSRTMRLMEWDRELEARAEIVTNRFEAAIIKADGLKQLGWEDSAEKTAASHLANADSNGGDMYGGKPLPLSAFPESLQTALREQIETHNKEDQTDGNGSGQWNGERVFVSSHISLRIEIPGVGTAGENDGLNNYVFDPGNIESSGSGGKPTTAQLAAMQKQQQKITNTPLPTTIKNRIVLLAPRSEDELRSATVRLKAHGATQLWIAIPEDETAAKSLLKSAVAVGKAEKMPIVALVDLLGRKPSGACDYLVTEDADRNILGETSLQWARRQMPSDETEPDVAAQRSREYEQYLRLWHRPDPSKMATDAHHRLSMAASVNGLAGLAVVNTVPPGYSGNREFQEDISASGLGYSLPMRLAFLRKEGIDPIDLSSGKILGSVDVDFPIVGRDWEKQGEIWNGFRGKTADGFLAGLYESVHGEHPALPLFIRRGNGANGIDSGLVEPWQSAKKAAPQLSVTPGNDVGSIFKAMQNAMKGKTIYLTFTSNLPTGYDEVMAAKSALFFFGERTGGFVLDMTEFDFAKGLAIAERILGAPTTPSK